MWRSSIPRNWSAISDRPTRLIRGKNHLKRDTMEFLRETQRYIDYICKPFKGDEEILGLEAPGTSRGKRRVASPLGSAVKGKEVVSGDRTPAAEIMKTAATPVLSSSPAPYQRRSLTRQLTLPRTRVEPGFYTPEPAQEEYLTTAYLFPRPLIPSGKKPPRRRNKFGSMDIEVFLNRFDHKQEPDEAQPVSKGLTGWKLTLGSRGIRVRSQSSAGLKGMRSGSGNASPSSQLGAGWSPTPT